MHRLIPRPPDTPRPVGLLTLPIAQVAGWQTAHLHLAWLGEVQAAVDPDVTVTAPTSLADLYDRIHALLEQVNTTLFPIVTLADWARSEGIESSSEVLTSYRDYFGDLIPFCIQGVHHDDSPDDLAEPFALLYRLLDLELGGPALRIEIEAQYSFTIPPDFSLPTVYEAFQQETGTLESQVAKTLAVLARDTGCVFLDSCPCGEHHHDLDWERDNLLYLVEQWHIAQPFEQAQAALVNWYADQPEAKLALDAIWSIFARLHLRLQFEDEYGYRQG